MAGTAMGAMNCKDVRGSQRPLWKGLQSISKSCQYSKFELVPRRLRVWRPVVQLHARESSHVLGSRWSCLSRAGPCLLLQRGAFRLLNRSGLVVQTFLQISSRLCANLCYHEPVRQHKLLMHHASDIHVLLSSQKLRSTAPMRLGFRFPSFQTQTTKLGSRS